MSLQVENLSWAYGEETVLKNISFSLQEGKFTALLGINGSGKSTLLNCLNGELPQKEGKIFIVNQGKKEDLVTFTQKERVQKIATVPQGQDITFPYTVKEVVEMGRYPYLAWWESQREEDTFLVEEAIKESDLLGLKNKFYTEISGGEKQRVLIARALAQNSSIMLLDEPASHLDVAQQNSLFQYLKRLQKKERKTVLTTLHDINHAIALADDTIFIHRGEIFAYGKTEDVLTEANIEKVYGVVPQKFQDSKTGKPYFVFPL